MQSMMSFATSSAAGPSPMGPAVGSGWGVPTTHGHPGSGSFADPWGAPYMPPPMSSDCGCGDRNMSELAAMFRMFGTPRNAFISQGQGDVPPVMTASGPRFMSYAQSAAVLDGRHMAASCAGFDAYRTDGGLMPASMFGITAAPPRAEEYLQTRSIGLVTPKGGEFVSSRPILPMADQQMMNLMPMSEAAATRQMAADKLGAFHLKFKRHQLQQAGYLAQ